MGKITMCIEDTYHFAPGDLLNTGERVTGIDRERGVLRVQTDSPWLRFRFGLRTRAVAAWRWLVCTAYDLRDWVRGNR